MTSKVDIFDVKNAEVSIVKFTSDIQQIGSSEINSENLKQNESKFNPNNQEKSNNLMTTKFKYYLLAFFSCVYLIYGLTESFLGSSLIDLVKILKTDSKHISYAWSFRNFVYCFSTILVDFLFRYFGNRELQYTIAVFVLGLTWGFIPFMVSFTQYVIGYFFSGFACAFVDSVTNLVILEIFSSNSKIYMQLAHLAYATGSIFGPLIIGPFLSKDNSTENLSSPIIENSNTENDFHTEIKIPYVFGASLFIISSLFFLVSQIIKPYVPEERKLFAKKKVVKEIQTTTNNSIETINNIDNFSSQQNIIKTEKETLYQQINLPRAYFLTFLGLTGLIMSIFGCIDSTNSVFLPTYLSNGELNLSKIDSAFMASLLNMSMTIGRFLIALCTIKLSCKTLLFINSSLILVGYFILFFFAIYSKFLIWLSMSVIGFGLSSTYPLMFSFVEDRIITTNSVQLYLLFSSSFLQLFVPIIIGSSIDKEPAIFTLINCFLAVLAFVLMILIHQVDIWQNKLVKIKEEEDKSIENK